MRRLIALAVSFSILALLYWKIDAAALLAVLGRSDPLWTAGAVLLVVPMTAITAWRFAMMAPGDAEIGFVAAVRLVLMAGVLNMVLPSKMGDIAKAYALVDKGHMKGPSALSLVVLEKGWDMLSLLAWGVLGLFLLRGMGWHFPVLAATIGAMLAAGLLIVSSARAAGLLFSLLGKLAPGKAEALKESWGRGLAAFWADPRRAFLLIGLSLFLWFLHLFQIWAFARALGGGVPLSANLGLAPLALLAGLLPFTMAGIGTRDAALVLFYAPYLDAPTAGALGVFCTLRYFLPALAGLPFLNTYLKEARIIGARGTAGLEKP